MKILTEFVYDDDNGKVEILKQEVVEADKDWNLAEETINWIRDETTQETKTGRFYTQENVKKCRDLLFKELTEKYHHQDEVENIINKRFGDL